MIERAIAAGVPFAWVAADTIYGVAEIERALRRAGKGYVLGVKSSHVFTSQGREPPLAGTAETLARALDAAAWKRLSAGEGTKGARLHDWAYVELADLDAAACDGPLPGSWTRGLLIRRDPGDGDMAFFSTWCPTGTGIEALVRVEGHRWAVEEGFETAKNELGLDHNETRSWHGWHRHVSLVMLAFAMLAAIRHRVNTMPLSLMKQDIHRKRRRGHAGVDPLVGSGNPAHRHQAHATKHPARPGHRLVALAKGASGHGQESAPQT